MVLVSIGPSLYAAVLPGTGHLVVQPAQLELFPCAHVAGHGADIDRAIAHPGAGGHQGPEAGPVLAARGIVQIRQAEVMAEFMGEDTHTAVLRLDGVLADPVVAVADLDAASTC